jgi:putative tricarboxylic transport membrane protein
VAGIVVGALPGLTTSVGLAVLIPLTFGMNPLVALGLMAGLYNGSMYGGAIPAILLNIPGTPAAIATTFDGYPMAQQGRSATALRIACYSSAVGGMVSALSLILLAPPLAQVTLAFGPAEYFWVAMVGLVSVSVLLGADPLKGLISAALGLLIATVGMDALTGRMRFTFGTLELVDGISITVLLVGLFALPRVFQMAEEGRTTGVSAEALSIKGHGLTVRAVLDLVPTWLRAGVIGIIVGILPGAGGNMAAFLSYNETKRAARDGASFGSGNPKGVAAAEAGNSSDNGASLIPTLTLGVPGNAIAALIMGGLLVQGLQPGPALFRENATVVYGFMLQMLLTSVLIFVLGGLIASRLFAQVLRMPQVLLAPMIVCLMVLGIYTVTGSIFSLYLMGGFGLLGYAMGRLDFPLPPLVLGAILGDMAEQSLRTALRIARGDWSYLLSSTVSRILIAVIVLMLLAQAVRWARTRLRAGAAPHR